MDTLVASLARRDDSPWHAETFTRGADKYCLVVTVTAEPSVHRPLQKLSGAAAIGVPKIRNLTHAIESAFKTLAPIRRQVRGVLLREPVDLTDRVAELITQSST